VRAGSGNKASRILSVVMLREVAIGRSLRPSFQLLTEHLQHFTQVALNVCNRTSALSLGNSGILGRLIATRGAARTRVFLMCSSGWELRPSGDFYISVA
jgi:hypothetical protein